MEGVMLLRLARWAGLLAMLVILFQLLSMGKGRTLDSWISKQRLVLWHRRGLWTLAPLMLLHVVLVLYGRSLEYEDTLSETLRDVLLDGRWGTMTAVGMLILLIALIASGLFLRKKLAFPTFKKTHLLMYLAAPLLFIHQIFFGLDFITSKTLTWAWSLLCAGVAADLVIWKIRSLKLFSH